MAKIAIVTGGTRGIGAAISRGLQAAGCTVAATFHGNDEAAAKFKAATGVAVFKWDVADPAASAAGVAKVEAELGPVDILVNNAGIMTVGAHDEEDDAAAVRMIEINLHGVILGTKEAMRRFKPRGTGHIVNVASSAGKTGFPHLATYCATKHAVVGLSEAVRSELRGTGVDISVVMPNIVNTELSVGLEREQRARHEA